MLRTPRLMTLTAPALLAGALALGGCQSPPKIDVEVQWADAMGRLNMFGFYPQSEDVQVGDIFLHAPQRGGGPSLPRFSLVRLASFAPNAVLDQLQGQQGRRGQPRPDTRKAGARLTIMPLPPAPAANTISQITATANCGDYDIIEGRLNDLTVFVVRQRFVKVTNSSNHVLSPFEWMQQFESTSRVFVRVRSV